MRFKAVTLGLVLAGTALGSAALSLGRARGAAWIGQPLELLIPVQSDPGQTDGTLCAEADVFHGDSRQDASRVQVQVMPGEQPDTLNLKVNSSALIDEPVVTIYLRAGCGQKSSRKYVLLADFPTESAAPLSRATAPTAVPVPLVIPVEATSAAASSPVATPTPPDASNATPAKVVTKRAQPRAASSPKVAKEVAKAAPKAAPRAAPKADKPAAAPLASGAGKPRLRLDPLDTLSERVKTLETSTTASAVPDEVAREGQRMQALQNDLKTLLAQAAKNEASLQAMRERLEKAESERVPLGVVYGLGALVALCLGALAYLWSRRSRLPVWEQPAMAGPASAAVATPLARPAYDAGSHQDVDVALVDMDDESFDKLMGQPPVKR